MNTGSRGVVSGSRPAASSQQEVRPLPGPVEDEPVGGLMALSLRCRSSVQRPTMLAPRRGRPVHSILGAKRSTISRNPGAGRRSSMWCCWSTPHRRGLAGREPPDSFGSLTRVAGGSGGGTPARPRRPHCAGHHHRRHPEAVPRSPAPSPKTRNPGRPPACPCPGRRRWPPGSPWGRAMVAASPASLLPTTCFSASPPSPSPTGPRPPARTPPAPRGGRGRSEPVGEDGLGDLGGDTSARPTPHPLLSRSLPSRISPDLTSRLRRQARELGLLQPRAAAVCWSRRDTRLRRTRQVSHPPARIAG